MHTPNNADTETILRAWRARVFNSFLIILILVTLPALVATLANSASETGIWSTSTLFFPAVALILIGMAVFRGLPSGLRVSVLLACGYLVAIFVMLVGGFASVGPLYLLVTPIIALIFVGKRVGVFATLFSALLLVIFAWLINQGLVRHSYVPHTPWMDLSTILALLAGAMTPLVLFYRFQERLITRERRAQADLLQTQALLEEQNATLEQRIEERTAALLQSNKIQTAIYKITDAASASHDVQEFYASVHRIVGELMYARNFYIALYDEVTGWLSFPYFVDEMDDPVPPQQLENFHGLTGYIIRTGRTVKHGNDRELKKEGVVETVGTTNEDSVGAPLKFNEKVIGAVRVQSYTKDIYYSEKDDEMLTFVAQHIATALMRFRALESERQRTTELDIINSVQSGLAAELDFQAIITLAGDKLREAFATPTLVISQYDEQTNQVHYLYAYEQSERLEIGPQPPHPGGIIAQLIERHQPVCLDYGGRKDTRTLVMPGTKACQSGLAIPIISSDRLLGVIQIEDFEREYAYGESEQRLLTTIAASLGAALENVHLTLQRNEAVDALRHNEEIFRKIVNNLPQYISIWDLNMECTYVSPGLYRLTGYTPEERMALKKEDFLPPESLTLLQNALREALIQDQVPGRDPNLVIVRELEEIRKDGSRANFESTYTFLRDAGGAPVGILAITADISERKKMEAQRDEAVLALRQSEEMYRLITENSDDVIWTTNTEYRLTYVSPAIYKLRGLTPEEAMRETLSQTTVPESLNALLEAYNGAFPEIIQGQDTTIRLEIEQFRQDGSTVWVEIARRPIRDSAGRLTGFVGVSRDISERKRTEQALRESERRLADIINFLPIATLVIDNIGRVTAWNHALEEMTGVKSESMLGKGEYEYGRPFYGKPSPILIDLVNAPDEKVKAKYRHVQRKGGILSAEAYHKLLGAKGSILIGFASPLYGADGEVRGAIESIRDVTDLRQAESKLKEAKEAAEAANRSKSIFLANMSHEIRTPMNAILGFVQLMKRDPDLSARQMEHLEVINRSGEHLLALINDILELSKIEAGRAAFMPGNFDLHKLLEDLEMMFRVRADDKKLWLTLERLEGVPRWVITDEGKLRQVLINLLGNAVKFTEQGGIGVRIGLQPGPRGKEKLMFEVEDTGPGISAKEIKKLFNAFEQTSSGIKVGGTGLGLALCRGFVRIMGGGISVSSAAGKGSVFRFSIPVEEGREVEVERDEALRRVTRLRPGQGEIRILVADDRETNRQFLTQMLSLVGFTVQEAVNGAEAVAAFNTWHPRIILMDMSMPVMNGYEALQAIKATPEGLATVIIAITASAFQDDRRRVMAAGADGYLSKPFREADLFETIHHLTGVSYLYDEEQAREAVGAGEEPPLVGVSIAALSPELVRKCREATENADIFGLMELIREVSDVNPTVAQHLYELASRYEYEEIINLLSLGA